MKLHIKTGSQSCHVIVNIKLDGFVLLKLMDNDERFMDLLKGITYTFEWFVFTGPDEGHADIFAEVIPPTEAFPLLHIEKDYPAGSRDGNLFDFTL